MFNNKEEKLDISLTKAIEISEEYRYLFQIQHPSNSDINRISEILNLGVSSNILSNLLAEVDSSLIDDNQFTDDYLDNQNKNSLRLLDEIDNRNEFCHRMIPSKKTLSVDTTRKLKQKIKRLWRQRLLVTIGGLAVLGFSVLQLQNVLRYRSPQPAWTLDLYEAVEIISDKESSEEKQKKALLKIRSIAQKHELTVTRELTLDQNLALDQDLDLALALERELNKELSNVDIPQARVLSQELVQTLEQVQNKFQSNLLVPIVSTELEQKHGLQLHQDAIHANTFLISVILLTLSLFVLIVLIIMLSKLRLSYGLAPNSHLIAFLPEECVAELSLLKRRMENRKISIWHIRFRILQEFLILLWVFYGSAGVSTQKVTVSHTNRPN